MSLNQQTGGSWRDEAACYNQSDTFINIKHFMKAARICDMCPVKPECRREAQKLGKYAIGTWAGTWQGDYE